MTTATATAGVPKLAFTIPEVCAATGFGEQKIRNALRSGELKSKRGARDKDGNGIGQHIVLAKDLQAYLDGLADG